MYYLLSSLTFGGFTWQTPGHKNMAMQMQRLDCIPGKTATKQAEPRPLLLGGGESEEIEGGWMDGWMKDWKDRKEAEADFSIALCCHAPTLCLYLNTLTLCRRSNTAMRRMAPPGQEIVKN